MPFTASTAVPATEHPRKRAFLNFLNEESARLTWEILNSGRYGPNHKMGIVGMDFAITLLGMDMGRMQRT